MKVRMVPVGNAFNKFPRIVRDLARSLGKEIELSLEGAETDNQVSTGVSVGHGKNIDPVQHIGPGHHLLDARFQGVFQDFPHSLEFPFLFHP